MFEVVFYDYGDEEMAVSFTQFQTAEQATDWADGCIFDYDDIAIDENGNDYWKTIYNYCNPEDNQVYVSYDVRVVE